MFIHKKTFSFITLIFLSLVIFLTSFSITSCGKDDISMANYVGNNNGDNWYGFNDVHPQLTLTTLEIDGLQTYEVEILPNTTTNKVVAFPNFVFNDNKQKTVITKIKNLNNLCGTGKIILPNNLIYIDNDDGIYDKFAYTTIVNFSYALEEIGTNFLLGVKSPSLKLVNFNFSEKIIIGNNFLSGADELQEINLDAIENITEIGENFLANCSKLNCELNFKNFTKVWNIPNGFMAGCSSLKTLDFTGYSSTHAGLGFVETIGLNFLYDCTSLEQIDMHCLVNWDNVPHAGFLENVNPSCNIIWPNP